MQPSTGGDRKNGINKNYAMAEYKNLVKEFKPLSLTWKVARVIACMKIQGIYIFLNNHTSNHPIIIAPLGEL